MSCNDLKIVNVYTSDDDNHFCGEQTEAAKALINTVNNLLMRLFC
jgi:hypothetical protein